MNKTNDTPPDPSDIRNSIPGRLILFGVVTIVIYGCIGLALLNYDLGVSVPVILVLWGVSLIPCALLLQSTGAGGKFYAGALFIVVTAAMAAPIFARAAESENNGALAFVGGLIMMVSGGLGVNAITSASNIASRR